MLTDFTDLDIAYIYSYIPTVHQQKARYFRLRARDVRPRRLITAMRCIFAYDLIESVFVAVLLL